MRADIKITLGILCCQTKEETVRCFRAAMSEMVRLRDTLDYSPSLVIVDNGNDGTCDALRHIINTEEGWGVFGGVHSYSTGQNMGQSWGRNLIADSAKNNGSDYILFLDGDIQVVPKSVQQMIEYMEERPQVGCFSPHPVRQTRNPEAATKKMEGYEFILNDIRSACTGYALYRTGVFRLPNPCRFEVGGPFMGPGWGLEDDDIYLQMITAGWKVDYFVGIVYLQRKPRSSWAYLQEQGCDVRATFEARKEFFLEKWKTKGVSPAILLAVQGQNLSNLRA